eukprot:6861028-Ditylum_brightwellii.AAC.1
MMFSLLNLKNSILGPNTTNNSSYIIQKISHNVKVGGFYKISSSSAAEILTIFHLSGIGCNLSCTASAVISEGTHTYKSLEKAYGFKKAQ